MIARCKHRKGGDKGIVDGCGWVGELPTDGRCPNCGAAEMFREARPQSDIDVTLRFHDALERCAELLGLEIGANLADDVPRVLAEKLGVLQGGDYPRKPIEVRISANGFNWEQVIAALDERVERLTKHREKGVGCSASGYSASHSADVFLRDVTVDQFVDESIAWLERQKAEKQSP